jgi:NADH dehydrogenase FAD-containing subunit
MTSTVNHNRKKVVVIGGGYAGIAAASALDDVADVTLIDRKTAFFHRVAALRAAVDPAWTDRPFLPYDRLLRNGSVVHGTVSAIEPELRHITLETGEVLSFDAAIIATGSEASAPAQFGGTTVNSAAATMQKHQRNIRDARSVVIVGGGPVGVELAGEIRTLHPDKTMTLVQAEETLLAGSTPKLGHRAHELLVSKGVTVRLGQHFDAAEHPDSLVLWAVGNKPNTGWFGKAHGDKLTERGLIRVDRQLRVDGWDAIFAIGDANDADPKKLVMPAIAQAKVAARNVRAVLARKKADAVYQSPRGEMLIVPVGPDDGVSVLAGVVVGRGITRRLKGTDLFLPKYRNSLNLPRHHEHATLAVSVTARDGDQVAKA